MTRLGVIALVLTACGGAAPKQPTVAAGVEPDEAVREARSLVEEAYGSLRRGEPEGLLSFLSPDVVLLGPDATQILPAGSDALVALGDWLEAANVKGGKHKLKSRDLQVVASPGGHSAWATDQIELDAATYAMTAILVEDDELWTFRAVHVARTWKPKQLGKRTPEPGAAFPAAVAPDLELVERSTEAITDLEARLDQLPASEDDAAFDVVVMSTAPRGATHGVKKITKAWSKLIKKAHKKKKPTPLPVTELVGDPLTGATADGGLAWVCANVTTEDDDGPRPHRVFLLYARDGDEWRLMSYQDAAITK